MKSLPLARWGTIQTPFGPLRAAIDTDGALVATAFDGLQALKLRAPLFDYREDQGALAPVARQISAYLRNPKAVFSVKFAPQGSAFQRRVWAALRAIPSGETRSYGQLAAELGSSPRAIGRANATNPVCLIVPCHRVIGSDGSLTGFAFGEDIKRGLLAHEGVSVALEKRGSRQPALAASASP
ncbi:MAG TPA: methylated-DNA--[protein]-cysteine S-methyltransferase [Opitutaceae bacterium]|jgi:methylated-DNA-[protein]-cysteine S-methyltransferase